MGALDQVSEKVQNHIRQLIKSSGLPDSEESVEAIAQGWLEKQASFEEQVEERNMEEVDFLASDDQKGCLLMTYSGSLLNIGPLVDEVRKAEYTSIGMRQDVPESAEEENSKLDGDIEVDNSVTFIRGPIKKSSPIFKIAVPAEDMEAEEQEELLSEVTKLLTEDFVEVNKTIILEE
jgi:hypothetical protein